MQASTQYGFAFLCNPKCGSTSIEAAIKPFCNVQLSGHAGIKHIDARTFENFVRPLHRRAVPGVRLDAFCLMREPLSWIQSWYRFRTREALKEPEHPNHQNYTGNIAYNDFVEAYLMDRDRPMFANLPTQFEFLRGAEFEVGVDLIFSKELIEVAASYLGRKIGKKMNFKVLNRSPSADVSLDAGLEKRLREHLRVDIALHNFIGENGRYSREEHAERIAVLLGQLQ